MASIATADEIRTAIITTLQGTVPSRAARSGERWEPVFAKEDVPAGGVRKFFVEMGTPQAGSVWGGGLTFEFAVSIWTSYIGLNKIESDLLIVADRNQVWLKLERQVDPTTPGLWAVGEGDWQAEDDTEGSVWGRHVIPVWIFMSDQP